MSCFCGNIDCKFRQKEAVTRQKLIASLNHSLNVNDIVHILMSGVKILNLDLSFGTYKDHISTSQNIDRAIEKYQENTEFNIPITKTCTIRGKSNIVGRMRNDCMWKLDTGKLITLTCDERYETCSTDEVCYISNFESIIQFLKICDIIQVGMKIELHVVKIVGCYVTCCVSKSGLLKSYQKLFYPQFKYNQRLTVNQEIQDCNFAIEHKFDFILVPNVQKPEYFHSMKKLIKGTDVKLIGKIEGGLENEVIRRIFEHFHGLFVDSKDIDLNFVSSMASVLKKPVLAKFPTEGSRHAIQICEISDCLELKVTCFSTLMKVIKKLKRISSDIDKYAEYNQESCTKSDKDDTKYSYIYSDYATNEAGKFLNKPVICITKRGDTIKQFENRYIIALTKDDKIAKILQLQRNVVPMIYVDCEEKSWKEQVTEMTRIAMKYLSDNKIIVNEKSVVVQYDE